MKRHPEKPMSEIEAAISEVLRLTPFRDVRFVVIVFLLNLLHTAIFVCLHL